MVRERFYRSLTPRGQNLFQFRQRYGIAPRVRYAVTSRKNTDSLVDGMIFLDQGGGGGEGGKGHGPNRSPPSVRCRSLFFGGIERVFIVRSRQNKKGKKKLAGEAPLDPLAEVAAYYFIFAPHSGDDVWCE